MSVEPLRSAATVVVARPGPSGVEILVLRRSLRSRFVPGFVVFPGGSVDPSDGDLAIRWFGSPEQASRACAIRELAEEARLVLSSRGVAGGGAASPAAPDFEPPSREQLPQIGRWIAPEFMPVRFDATFFAAACDRGVEPRADGREVDEAWWARPDDVLAAQRSGELPLAWPTMKTLEALAGCSSVDDVLALRIPQVAPQIPRSEARP